MAVTASQLIGNLDHIRRAAVAVAALPPDMWADVGRKFTCDEADTITALLRTVNVPAARPFLLCHADGDEPTDRHYLGQPGRARMPTLEEGIDWEGSGDDDA